VDHRKTGSFSLSLLADILAGLFQSLIAPAHKTRQRLPRSGN